MKVEIDIPERKEVSMILSELLRMTVPVGAMLLASIAYAQGQGGGGKAQVGVEGLQDISGSLKMGLTAMFEPCAKKILGNDGPCTMENMGTTRDPNANYGAKNSCHKNKPADAVDMGAIHCGGASMKPKDETYKQMAECMANGTGLDNAFGANGLRVIYGNGTPSQGNLIADPSGKHDDHIHAMVPGCSYGGGGGEAKYDYSGNYDDESGSPQQ